VVPSGTDAKWLILLMSKKQNNVVLILDFGIRGFFGLGIHHKQSLTSLTFYLAISAVEQKHSQPLSVPSYTPFSHVDKVDAQCSNELLSNEYWTQLIQTLHVSSVLLRHRTFQVTEYQHYTFKYIPPWIHWEVHLAHSSKWSSSKDVHY
jgi:hypothetical protein